MIKSTIAGVVSIPQSSTGSILFYLAQILPNTDQLSTVYNQEKAKRDFNTFNHQEFGMLVAAANNQHKKPSLKTVTERAPIVDANLFELHQDMFRLKGFKFRQKLSDFEVSKDIVQRMYWRLFEIYRFPTTSLPSVLEGIIESIAPNAFDGLGRFRENNRIETLQKIITSPSMKAHLEFIGRSLNDYLSSPRFRNELVKIFQKLPAEMRARKRAVPTSEKLVDLEKDGMIAGELAFDLYPIFRERFPPDTAFLVSMAVLGFENGRSTDIFVSTMHYRRDYYGLDDTLLNEVLSALNARGIKIVGERFFEKL